MKRFVWQRAKTLLYATEILFFACQIARNASPLVHNLPVMQWAGIVFLPLMVVFLLIDAVQVVQRQN